MRAGGTWRLAKAAGVKEAEARRIIKRARAG
jgi:hypothetical protein